MEHWENINLSVDLSKASYRSTKNKIWAPGVFVIYLWVLLTLGTSGSFGVIQCAFLKIGPSVENSSS